MKPVPLSTILFISLSLISCQKDKLQPSVKSSSLSDAKRTAVEITFDWHYRGSQYADFYDGAGNFLAAGEVIYDSCAYASLINTEGTVKIYGYLDPDNLIPWSMVIEEKRGPATMTIGDPYYYISYFGDAPIMHYSADLEKEIEDGTIFPPDVWSGPYRDTATTGTGNWKIISSTHPAIQKGSGTLTYSASIWYGFGRFSIGESWDQYTPADVRRTMWPTDAELRGKYK